MSIRFNKESKIKFLEHSYTLTSQYYSWHSMEYAPGMLVCFIAGYYFGSVARKYVNK